MSKEVKNWCSSVACKIENIQYLSFSYDYCKECKCEVSEGLKGIKENVGTNSVVDDHYWYFDAQGYTGL